MPKASAVSVLIVDDQQSMRGICKYILTQLGFTNIIEAKSGRDALGKLEKTNVDLIISDIKMPNFDGIELHRFTREMKQYAKTKFVFISGYRDQYSSRLEMNPEQDYFLDKTMAALEIVKFVDRLMFGKFAEVWV